MKSGEISEEDGLSRLEVKYSEMIDSLTQSNCERTVLMARYSDLVERWFLCKKSVPIGDWCFPEVEGNDWMCIWAAVGKPNYLLQGKRRAEILYALEPWKLEYLRNSRYIQMTDGGEHVSPDDFCEKHNRSEKKLAGDPDFNRVCDRSKHLHFMEQCSMEYLGEVRSTKSTIPNMNDDINDIEAYLERVGVIDFPDAVRKMDGNSFWEEVVPKPPGSKTKRDRSNEEVAYTEHDRVVLEVFMSQTPKVSGDLDSSHRIAGDQNTVPESGSVGDEGSVGTASVASLRSLNSTQTQGEEEFGDDEMGAEMANLREATARRNADENKLKKKTDQVEALKSLEMLPGPSSMGGLRGQLCCRRKEVEECGERQEDRT